MDLAFWPDLAVRRREPELMDQPDIDPVEHRKALRGLARINRLSRSSSIVWQSLARLARESPDRPLHVLDVACGAGDMAIAIKRTARLRRLAIEVSGCDISETALEHARRNARQAAVEIDFFAADAIAGALPSNYDVIMCSLFLHHLDRADAVQLLRQMAAAARRAVLVNDLRRSRLGYLMAYLVPRLLTRSKIVHVDGPLSVQAAFTLAEASELAAEAGLTDAVFARRFPQRFLMVWHR